MKLRTACSKPSGGEALVPRKRLPPAAAESCVAADSVRVTANSDIDFSLCAYVQRRSVAGREYPRSHGILRQTRPSAFGPWGVLSEIPARASTAHPKANDPDFNKVATILTISFSPWPLLGLSKATTDTQFIANDEWKPPPRLIKHLTRDGWHEKEGWGCADGTLYLLRRQTLGQLGRTSKTWATPGRTPRGDRPKPPWNAYLPTEYSSTAIWRSIPRLSASLPWAKQNPSIQSKRDRCPC